MATTPSSPKENPTPQQNTPAPQQATPDPKNQNPTPAPKEPAPSNEEHITASSDRVIAGISQEVIDELNSEINVMLAFAANKGLTINTEVVALVKSESIDDLVDAHNMLCKNVSPATPKSIIYTRRVRNNNRSKSFFRQIPLVRNLILLTLFFLTTFVLFSLTEQVNNDSLDKGVLANNGLDLFYNLGFLASVAGLGVLFHLLKEVSTSVRNSTLVPEESINYVSQILLGIIAGLFISEIISVYNPSTDPEASNLFNKTLLALIGGFSSDAIFTILEGLITRLKAIFTPSGSK